MDYNVIRHDIEHINWIEISQHDIVITGGGGLLYVTQGFQKNLNKILDACPTVIAWSVGFNTHSDNPINESLDTGRFKLIGIRDYAHPSGLAYLPCVSCLAPELDKVLDIKRRVGIIDHIDFPVPADISGDKMNNGENFQNLTDFIASSEIIISSSYHCIYWAILMNKRVICANPFSTKFNYYKYRPVFYSGDLEKDIAQTRIYPQALTEARVLNTAFFEKVKDIIQKTIPEKNKSYQYVYGATIPVLLHMRQKDIEYKFMSALEEKNNKLEVEISHLHERINTSYDEINILHNEINSLHDEINILHDEINTLHDELTEKTSLRYFAKKIKAFLRNRMQRLQCGSK